MSSLSTDIRAFARVSAERDGAADPTAVLASIELSEEAWERIQLEWAKTLLAEAQALQSTSLDMFIAAYREAEGNPASATTAPARTAESPSPPVVVATTAARVEPPPPPSPGIAAPCNPEAAPSVPVPREARRTVMHTGGAAAPALPFQASTNRPSSSPELQPTVMLPDTPLPVPPPQATAGEDAGGFTQAPGYVPAESFPFPQKPKPKAAPRMQIDLSMMPLERYAELTLALASGEPRPSVLAQVRTDRGGVAGARARVGREDSLDTGVEGAVRRRDPEAPRGVAIGRGASPTLQ